MNKSKILIVGDESIYEPDIRKILASKNYEVLPIVNSGTGLVDKVDEMNPDIILIDVFLKGTLDGIEAIEKIKLLRI